MIPSSLVLPEGYELMAGIALSCIKAAALDLRQTATRQL
jgi:hypothetical protein